MLILVIGAKGGVGATSLAKELVQGGNTVGLDLTDGQLAAQLERTAWTLTRVVFSSPRQRRQALDEVVRRRITLLWMPECSLAIEDAVGFVRAVTDRVDVVADGGIEPLEEIAALADVVIVVTEENPVAQYHERKLKGRFPDALVIQYDRETAQELIEQLFTQ
jgi:nucleoside-diphosphate-sugar epimerase